MRGIHTPAAANAVLPEFLADYNRRFAHAPTAPTPAWRRPPRDLALQLSCRYVRTVARDNTVRLGPRWLQLPPGPGGRSHAGRRVELRECLDGRLVALLAGRVLAAGPSPDPAFVLRPRARPHTTRRHEPARVVRSPRPPAWRPALAALAAALRPAARRHPWRQAFSRRERLRQRIRTAKG